MRAAPTVSMQSSSANSLDRYGRGQETCYPIAENVYAWGFQNIIKKDASGNNTNWQDDGNYIVRGGYKAEVEF